MPNKDSRPGDGTAAVSDHQEAAMNDTLHAPSVDDLLAELREQISTDPDAVWSGHPATKDLICHLADAWRGRTYPDDVYGHETAAEPEPDPPRGRRYAGESWETSTDRRASYDSAYDASYEMALSGISYDESVHGAVDGWYDGLEDPDAGEAALDYDTARNGIALIRGRCRELISELVERWAEKPEDVSQAARAPFLVGRYQALAEISDWCETVGGIEHDVSPASPDWWHDPQPEPDNRTREEEIEDLLARVDELEAGGS